ncbi:hypothetical protein FRC98_09835 [Lujinxingia vulgaris]|uniref:non-specific serine/threonine protein kinase n=1 Tax=Lujinxingia vulgaris TaxID=2600176 RepID=A0A5C6X5F7_9DELT|nr:hypothetical protein [Lujinxingia vulgaris]TXD37030.1 hypothetical protein FRC98_09835 [Lujinxingia vulgaris]
MRHCTIIAFLALTIISTSCKHEAALPEESINTRSSQPNDEENETANSNHDAIYPDDPGCCFSVYYLRALREHRNRINANRPRTTSCSMFDDQLTFRKIYTSGGQNVCGLDGEGNAKCFGFSADVFNEFASKAYTNLRVGYDSICTIDPEGKLSCTGDTDSFVYRWLADDGYDPLTPPNGHYQAIGTGISTIRCAINFDGAVDCWGKSPDLVPGDEPEVLFQHISVSSDQACGISIDNELHCWGSEITDEPLPEGSFNTVDCSGRSCCAIRDDRSLICWSGSQRDHDPVNFEPVYDVPTGGFSQVCTGVYFACGLDNNGEVTCWGDELYHHGQSALVVPRPATGFSDIACGLTHVCGLDGDGRIICWGEDFEDGQECPESMELEDLGVRQE